MSTGIDAQIVIQENPSYTNSTQKPLLNKWLEVDVLRGGSRPEEIGPIAQKICFDKKIKIKTVIARGTVELCLFLNTKIGLVAYTPLEKGGAGSCDIQPASADFRFNIMSVMGNTYSYMNSKKKGLIEHWVITSNSQDYQYRFEGPGIEGMLFKKDESVEYCGNKVKAWAYKYNDQPQKWYLFGKLLPDAVRMQPKNFLGNFGVGYVNTDKGLFIIMQLKSERYNAEILDIEDVETCFDPRSFKVFEDAFYREGMESISREKDRLLKRAANIEPDQCAGVKLTSIYYQLQMLERRQQNLERSMQGNLMQQHRTQQSQVDALINYEDNIQALMYETDIKICQVNKRIEEATSSTETENLNRKLSCLKSQLIAQRETQKRLKKITEQYPNDPGRQFGEKAKAFMQGLAPCD